MSIPDSEIVRMNYWELKDYDGDYVLLPINFVIQTDYHLLPLPDKIVPVFIGLCLIATEELTFEVTTYLKRYEPIGCRDEQTMLLLRRHGVAAYLAGCVTATLPRRLEHDRGGRRIFVVDLSDEIKAALPKHVLNSAEKITHIFKGEQYDDIDFVFETAREVLRRYREEARMVIASRLHALSPCIAMGIPTVGLFSNITPRHGWIDKLTPLYTLDNIDKIDWDVRALDYEESKRRMIDVCIRRIGEAHAKYDELLSLSAFFENRTRAAIDSFYYNRVKELPFAPDEAFSYIIWGCGQIGLRTVKVMRECFPNARLIGAIDTYSNAKNFVGLPVERPECIAKKYMDAFCVITNYSGESFVKEFLARIGKDDFASFASVNG